MIKALTSILVITLFSCSSFNGNIEFNDNNCGDIKGSKTALLVNTSKDKSYQFTVRKKSNGTSSTEVYQLYPGEQIEIGCTKYEADYATATTTTVAAPLIDTTDIIVETPNDTEDVENSYKIVGQLEIKEKTN